tara:strand:- start:19746 stop:21575 length:1830 start_codon:yes stop_codon:yes gene_type:complete
MIRNTLVPFPLSSTVIQKFAYERPEEFENLAVYTPGVTEIYTALHAVFPPGTGNENLSGINFAVFHADVNSGSISVDWGDGNTETMTSGATVYHFYDYNDLNPDTEFRGYRQVVLSAVPATDGSKFSDIDINVDGPWSPGFTANTNRFNQNILDLAMSSSGATRMKIGGGDRPLKMCEKTRLCNTTSNRLTDPQQEFWDGYTSIQDVNAPYMHVDTTESHQEVFRLCYKLRILPDEFADPDRYWFWNASSLYLAFDSCWSLRYLPEGLFDKQGQTSELANVTDYRYMFRYCYNLRYIPRLPVRTSGSAIRVAFMFEDCQHLIKLPKDFKGNNITSSSSNGIERLFYNCIDLEDFGDFSLAQMDSSARAYHSIAAEGIFRQTGRDKFEEVPWLGVDPTFINSNADIGGIGIIRPGNGPKRLNSQYFKEHGGLLDMTNITDAQDAFNSNRTIEAYPIIKVGPNKMTNSNTLFRMFFGNYCLKTIQFSGFDVDETFGNGEYYQMFYQNTQLVAISGLPFNAANDSGDYSSMFNSMGSLAHITFPGASGDETGFSESISLTKMPFTRHEIVNIFQYLKTVGGKTITLTNNNFADDLTAGELAIATGKGWTVTT